MMMAAALAAIIMLVVGSALAAEPDTYKLAVTPAQLNIIGTALASQPWSQVNGLIVDLQNQRLAQMRKADKAAPAKEPAKK